MGGGGEEEGVVKSNAVKSGTGESGRGCRCVYAYVTFRVRRLRPSGSCWLTCRLGEAVHTGLMNQAVFGPALSPWPGGPRDYKQVLHSHFFSHQAGLWRRCCAGSGAWGWEGMVHHGWGEGWSTWLPKGPHYSQDSRCDQASLSTSWLADRPPYEVKGRASQPAGAQEVSDGTSGS